MAHTSLQQEFVQLIASQQKLIHSICSLYYYLPEDRKDLFQEIVLQLWKSYPSFNHQSKVSTWIYRVAINTVFSKIRKDKMQPKSESLSETSSQVFQLPSSPEIHDASQDLYLAINLLSELDKAIIMLYLDEHSYREIATILDISQTNVSTRINRIKIKLEKLLKPQLL